MKVIYLGKNTNRTLRGIIELEYTREETSVLLDTISSILNNPFVKEVVAGKLVEVVNAVVLDNLIQFVKNRDPLSIVAGMQNNTFGLMLEVGRRHYIDLLTEELSSMVDSYETEKEVIAALSSYINFLYLNNKEDIDPAILEVFEMIYVNAGHLVLDQHRVVFVPGNQPAVILPGETHAVNHANAVSC